ncbi:MAG: CPBP family intramembrane metalloprotease [Anaerolineae bacterium]|nr:CPBP family intramembrane metalloprotease [Anaerolineae bacterium]
MAAKTQKRRTILHIGVVYLGVMLIVVTAPALRSLAASYTAEMLIKFALYLLMGGMVLGSMKVFKDPVPVLGYKKDSPGTQILLALPIFAGVLLLFVGIPLALGMNPDWLLPGKFDQAGRMALAIVHQVLFVGLVEELVFRGYILGKLVHAGFSRPVSVLVSAFLFGWMHFPVGQDFLQVILTFLLGCAWGSLRLILKNGSTLTTGVAHGLHNSALLLLRHFLF